MSFADYGMSILRNNRKLKSGHRDKYFNSSTDDTAKTELQFNEEFSFDENNDFQEVESNKNRKIYIRPFYKN